MKRFFTVVLAFALLLLSFSAADEIDLSTLSFDQLAVLRDQLNLAMWNSQEWQEVTVPEGVWVVGKDIPAGHWSIRVASEHDYLYVTYFDEMDPVRRSPVNGNNMFQQDIASPGYSAFGEKNLESVDIDMQDGWFFKCTGAVVFSPYTGKPDLGFATSAAASTDRITSYRDVQNLLLDAAYKVPRADVCLSGEVVTVIPSYSDNSAYYIFVMVDPDDVSMWSTEDDNFFVAMIYTDNTPQFVQGDQITVEGQVISIYSSPVCPYIKTSKINGSEDF